MELSDQVDALAALSQGMEPGGLVSSSAVLACMEERKVSLYPCLEMNLDSSFI